MKIIEIQKKKKRRRSLPEIDMAISWEDDVAPLPDPITQNSYSLSLSFSFSVFILKRIKKFYYFYFCFIKAVKYELIN